jgi:hypothetical protein
MTITRGSWRHRCAFLLAFMLMPSVIGASPSPDAGRSSVDMSALADGIAGYLKRNGRDSIAIGPFACPPHLSANAGPGIAEALASELRDREIAVRRRADWVVKGEYRLVDLVDDKDAAGPAARIKGEIVDDAGKPVFSFSRDIAEEGAMASLFGPTVELSPKLSNTARRRVIRAHIESPKAHINATRISAGPGMPYGLEISVDSGYGYVPREPGEAGGLAFVDIRRGEIYGIDVINDSDEDAAVTLTIDGLNMFVFSENPEYRFFIVRKKSRALIKGWHRTNKVSDAFQVTEYSKSAAAQLLPRPSEIGMITASFAAAWPKAAEPPMDERALFALRGEADATGRGPEVEASYKEVERKVGVTRAAISVRYKRAG